MAHSILFIHNHILALSSSAFSILTELIFISVVCFLGLIIRYLVLFDFCILIPIFSEIYIAIYQLAGRSRHWFVFFLLLLFFIHHKYLMYLLVLEFVCLFFFIYQVLYFGRDPDKFTILFPLLMSARPKKSHYSNCQSPILPTVIN